ncbi:MAG: ribosome biogenesis GTPase Der [Bdellovibrionota bacterium]|nr:MAG: ribosome biogenesis GTPase Der [Bdellovibrionota bacterium]
MSKLKVPTVAIVGRTNVGKSSLLNAIASKPIAVVEDQPGVTRDRHYYLVKRYDRPFTLVDTGGIVGEDENPLAKTVREQALLAIEEADVIVAVFDAAYGPHPLDSEVVQTLRRSGKPVIWVANKAESPVHRQSLGEFYALGIDEVLPVSAVHRQGIDQIVAHVLALTESDELEGEAEGSEGEAQTIRIAIVGQPNVGKSTLVNKLVGKERVVASAHPGTTRDAVDVEFEHQGRTFVVVDTAGLRRKARVAARSVEQHSNLRTVRALSSADVAVLLLDASLGPPAEQDAKVAALIHDRGTGLVIAVNKWDVIEKNHRTAKEYKDAVQRTFQFARYAPVLFVSAKSGQRVLKILEKCLEVYEAGKHRIQTSDLNRILTRAFTATPPPAYHGQPVKLFFATQVKTSPPTFVLFLNHPNRISESYRRYLGQAIRKHFDFPGQDLKFVCRKRTEKSARKLAEEDESSLVDSVS